MFQEHRQAGIDSFTWLIDMQDCQLRTLQTWRTAL